MSDENLATMGMVLGCAVKVVASTCIVTGQEKLARDIVQLWRDERFDELAATFETMSASDPKPPDLKPS